MKLQNDAFRSPVARANVGRLEGRQPCLGELLRGWPRCARSAFRSGKPRPRAARRSSHPTTSALRPLRGAGWARLGASPGLGTRIARGPSPIPTAIWRRSSSGTPATIAGCRPVSSASGCPRRPSSCAPLRAEIATTWCSSATASSACVAGTAPLRPRSARRRAESTSATGPPCRSASRARPPSTGSAPSTASPSSPPPSPGRWPSPVRARRVSPRPGRGAVSAPFASSARRLRPPSVPPPPPPPPPAPPPPAPPPSSAAGWTFYGPQNGLPSQVLGASADQAGNLWVAGGEAGLFVLRAGGTSFQRFTMVDGLRPYGYMADGSAPPGDKYLKILSVAGGPPGTVYVGYSGKPPAPGQLDCESNWDGPNPDPAIYKSGDADKVTLIGNGIAVVHYDIFSGPGIVKNELRGREKLCTILRIVYDPDQDAVWFGANHGFALGRATFQGAPACNGQFSCMGVYEHVHPAINAWGSNDPANTHVIFLTGDYYGVAIDPVTHDTWFGGATRSTKFHYATNGKNYWTAESLTEDAPYAANRIDLWPDKVAEPNYPRPSDRVDDFVSGIAALSDGTAWFGSFARGLPHVGANGAILGYVKDALPSANVSAVTADPSDQSGWTGFWYGGGLARLSGGSVTALYGATALGNLVQSPVSDLQIQSTPAGRRVLVAFQNGAVGIYSGK